MIEFDMLAAEGPEWRRFTGWLEERVSGLGPDEPLTIDMVPPDDSAPNAPCVQIEALPGGTLRAIALANPGAHAAMLERRRGELSTDAEACAAYYLQSRSALPAEVAKAVTGAFRDAYDVGHPAFLAADETCCS